MTDRLSQIRDRFDAIIPGPWRWYGNTATDQVMLATTDRGRLFILLPTKRATEFVFDHDAFEHYPLEDAQNRYATQWCCAHGKHVDPDDPGECQCDELREFLHSELDPSEGGREFDFADRGYHISLTRSVAVHSDLCLPMRIPGAGWERDRKQFGGIMRSYRDMAKYEVLGRRTKEQYEQESGRPAEHALYRQDFIGLDQPEATFIEHAPEDIGWLLDELGRFDELRELIREIGVRHGLTWEPDCSPRSMLAKLSSTITLQERRIENYKRGAL